MLVFSALWAKRSAAEPYLLGGTACFFALAIREIARQVGTGQSL